MVVVDHSLVDRMVDVDHSLVDRKDFVDQVFDHKEIVVDRMVNHMVIVGRKVVVVRRAMHHLHMVDLYLRLLQVSHQLQMWLHLQVEVLHHIG